MNEPPVELVFGRSQRFPPKSNEVICAVPAARIAAVSLRTAPTPKLSRILIRRWSLATMMAVVAAVVPRDETLLRVKESPSTEFAFAAATKTLSALRTLVVSRNSHISIAKSGVRHVIVVEATTVALLTR